MRITSSKITGRPIMLPKRRSLVSSFLKNSFWRMQRNWRRNEEIGEGEKEKVRESFKEKETRVFAIALALFLYSEPACRRGRRAKVAIN
jgi:hypothetical protein